MILKTILLIIINIFLLFFLIITKDNQFYNYNNIKFSYINDNIYNNLKNLLKSNLNKQNLLQKIYIKRPTIHLLVSYNLNNNFYLFLLKCIQLIQIFKIIEARKYIILIGDIISIFIFYYFIKKNINYNYTLIYIYNEIFFYLYKIIWQLLIFLKFISINKIKKIVNFNQCIFISNFFIYFLMLFKKKYFFIKEEFFLLKPILNIKEIYSIDEINILLQLEYIYPIIK
jgi:hypothetical protein